jgi:Glycosyltransferase Family 4
MSVVPAFIRAQAPEELMKIALIALPFVPVPPRKYGGTELFIAHLAEGLLKRGKDLVVYANGESTVDAPVRWLIEKAQWPVEGELNGNLKDLNHATWAARDAARSCDVIHLNTAAGLVATRFVDLPSVYTVHHPQTEGLSRFLRNSFAAAPTNCTSSAEGKTAAIRKTGSAPKKRSNRSRVVASRHRETRSREEAGTRTGWNRAR